jgi:ribosomal protein L29
MILIIGLIILAVAALGLSVLRGLFVRGLASRDLQKELKKSRAETLTLRSDFEGLQKELAAERAQNASRPTRQTPPIEQAPPSSH